MKVDNIKTIISLGITREGKNMLPISKRVSYEEFLEMDKNSTEILEYVEGEVHLQASHS